MSSKQHLRIGIRRAVIRHLALGVLVASGLTIGLAGVAGATTTPTNVVTDNSPTSLGGSIVFTATVTGTGGNTPTGTVTFIVAGTAGVSACTTSSPVLSGSVNTAMATCTITASAGGTYIVSDSYPGDGGVNYNAVTSATDTVTVSPATPTNVVTNNALTALGSSVEFTATVTGPTNGATPSGTVAFTVTGSAGAIACTTSSTTLSGSANAATATCTITASKAGSYIVSDVSPSTGTYVNVTSSNSTDTVVKATPTNVVTNNTLTALGSSVEFTATVTGPSNGATPSGTVAFTVNGSAGAIACTTSSPVLAGSNNVATATCTITASAAGNYTVSDVYSTDPNYLAETSAGDTVAASAVSSGGGTPPASNAPPPSGIAASSYGTPVSGSVTAGAPLTTTVTSGSATNSVVVPAGALPAGTVVSVYPITTTTALTALIPSGQSYVTSVAVTWASGATSPTATSPITLTITDPSIVVGDTVYALSSTGTLTSVGTATANGTVTVTFSSDPVFVVTSTIPLVSVPPVVIAHATRVVGVAVHGRTVTITIIGVGFYGRPNIVSSTGHATTALVTHDSGTQLSVRVTVKTGTASGVHTFKITLANGKSFDIHYSQR